MCFVNDYDSVSLGSTRPRAHKPHRCDECGRVIAPGDRYVRHAGVFDGRAYSMPECLRCERIRALIYEREIAEGCSPSESLCPFGEIAPYLDDRLLAYDEARDALVHVLAVEEAAHA